MPFGYQPPTGSNRLEPIPLYVIVRIKTKNVGSEDYNDGQLKNVFGSDWEHGKAAQDVFNKPRLSELADVGLLSTVLIAGGPFGSFLDIPVILGQWKTSDSTPWKDSRKSFQNAKEFRDGLDWYPWPGPKVYFVQALREFYNHEIRSIIYGPAVLTRTDVFTWTTLALVCRYEEVVDRVEALIRKKIRKSQRKSVQIAIGLTVIGTALGGILAGSALTLAKYGLDKLSGTIKRSVSNNLKEIAKELKEEAPGFALELERVAALYGDALPADEAARDPNTAPVVQEKIKAETAAAPASAPDGLSWIERLAAWIDKILRDVFN